MKKEFKVKRIYDPYSSDDGARILVDRLWARGINKEKAHIDEWVKEIAPSNELRKWYSHDPAKWEEFKERYFNELETKKELSTSLLNRKEPVITLLYSSKELKLNNAAALKEYLNSLQKK
jgi:uncharacterized protein YeaO (DUF488 family)